MKNKISYVIKIIENCILIMLGLALIVLLILATQKFIFKNKYPSFKGVTAFIVRTESMYPTLLTNDIVLVDKDSHEFEVGDIVSYEEKDYIVTHRITQINDDEIILRGDANNTLDTPISKSKVVGKVIKIVPNLRIWLMVLSDIKVILCICVTLCLYIIIKILMVIEEKMNVKEEKVFKN